MKIFLSVEKDSKKSENRSNQYIFDRLVDFELENFYSLENTLNKVDYFVDNCHNYDVDKFLHQVNQMLYDR